MTEGDKAFYKRRLREELHKAKVAADPSMRDLHLNWARLYQDRLDGVPRSRVAVPASFVLIKGGREQLIDYSAGDLSQAA